MRCRLWIRRKYRSGIYGRLLAERRKAQGLTQAELAGLGQTGNRFIGEFGRGKGSVQFDEVLHVLDLLGLDVITVAREAAWSVCGQCLDSSIGHLHERDGAFLAFAYAPKWMAGANARPLAPDLSLDGLEHSGKAVVAYFDNLLSDRSAAARPCAMNCKSLSGHRVAAQPVIQVER